MSQDISAHKTLAVNESDPSVSLSGATPVQRQGKAKDVLEGGLKLFSVLIVLLLLVKAFGVAHFSITTTLMLVTAAPLTVVLGTLASYGYMMSAIATLFALAWLWSLIATRRANPGRDIWVPVALAILVASVLLTPWDYWWKVLVGAALPLLLVWMWTRFAKVPLRRFPSFLLATGYTAALITGFLMYTLDKPWQSAEVVTFTKPLAIDPHGNPPVPNLTGYVIDTANGWVTILDAKTRAIVRVKNDQVQARQICHESGQLAGDRPILYLLEGKPYRSPNLACFRLSNN